MKAAQDEFDLAVVFHEVWKPAAYDKDLHKRMGVSYATNAFRVIVTALRREMLLALMRLWDKTRGTVKMDEIADTLSDRHLIDALAADRAAKYGARHIEAAMQNDFRRNAKEIVDLIKQYSKGGRREAVIERLRTVRHQRLAHRQIEPAAAVQASPTDKEIEGFYQDNSKLIRLLLSLVSGVGYDPEEHAKVFRHHASFFWAAACGEKTKGHPKYRLGH